MKVVHNILKGSDTVVGSTVPTQKRALAMAA